MLFRSQTNNDAKFLLFLVVLCINLYFLSQWIYRIADVTLRTQINRFRSWSCCYFLRRQQVNDYDKDLSLAIQSFNDSGSSFSKRFSNPLAKKLQHSNEDQLNKLDLDDSSRSSYMIHSRNKKVPKNRYRQENSDF